MSDTFGNLMKENGKSLPLSKLSHSFPLFLFYSTVVLPVWLSVLLPLTLTSVAIEKLVGVVRGSKRSSASKKELSSAYGSLDLASIPSPAQCEFDLILFGATGFTGTK